MVYKHSDSFRFKIQQHQIDSFFYLENLTKREEGFE